MKFKTGDIVVEIKNELTVEEVVGDIVHCRMANHQPVQFEADKLILISGSFVEEAKKTETGIGHLFHKAPPATEVFPPTPVPASDI